MRVLLAAGGTGGHLIPAIRIAEALARQSGKDEKIDFLFVGSDRGFEQEVIERRHHRYEGLPARGFLRTRPWRNVPALWHNMRARSRARAIVRDFAPDVAVGCGGYASYFPIKAAAQAKIPYALQEQNRNPGLATRWLAPRAAIVFTAFEESRQWLANTTRVEVTGNPVDPRLASLTRSDARRAWNLGDAERVILVTGGSGGARSINSSIAETLQSDCPEPPVTVLWQTGRNKVDWNGKTGAGWVLKEFEFTDAMTEAFVAADIIIARAGALTISEIAAAGKPALLVPFPHATDDHQTKNAHVLIRAGGAVTLRDDELTRRPPLLEALRLLSDADTLRLMGDANRAIGRPDAADRIARAVLSLATRRTPGDHAP